MAAPKFRALVQALSDRRKLSDTWDVPDVLWRRIQLNPNRLNSADPDKELSKLFQLARGPKQRALMGSLMLEQGLRLPLHLESQYIRALVQGGRVREAIQLWQSRRNVEDPAKWNYLGIFCFCHALRLPRAEQLAEDITAPPLAMCGWFVTGYSRIPQSPRLQHWTDLLVQHLKPNSTAVWNPVLNALVRFRCWPQVSLVIGRLELLKETLPRHIIGKLMLALPTTPLQLATALSRDPGIATTSVFRRVLARTAPQSSLSCAPNERVAALLKEKEVGSAKNLARTSLRRYQLILRHAARTQNPQLMDWVATHAPLRKLQQGRSVQIVLQYLFSRRKYSMLVRFMTYLSSEPQLLDAQSLTLMWRFLYVLLRNHRKVCSDPSFPDMRRLLEVTVSKCPVLERDVATWTLKALVVSKNFSALATILRYLEESCGSPVAGFDAIFAAVQDRSRKGQSSPKEVLTWKDVAERAANRSNCKLNKNYDDELYRELDSHLFITEKDECAREC